MNSLKNFFYPRSICIVGASTKEKSIGYEILKCIKNYGFTGIVLPVNPKADEILGFKTYNNINAIRESIDLAMVVVQKQFVEDSIEELINKKVKSIILITAGFKEIGKEGEYLEKRILDKILNVGARLVGPNCMGVINSLEETKLNATFVAEKPEVGKAGFFSQSGALGAAVLNSLRDTDIKFAHFISAGNKADVNENDLLLFWENDNNIKTLLFYLESFVDGYNFIQPFIKNQIKKPTIILKAGRTASGMRAASSHTGALSTEDKVVDSLLKQFGIIRVDNLNELFNTAKGFENFPFPKGQRVAVVTNAGGPAILCVDKLEKEELSLAVFSDETRKNLRLIVHPEGSIENPVDLLPGASADIYKTVIEVLLNDKNVDAVISIFVEPVMVRPFDVVESVSSIVSNKPVLQTVMPLPEFWNYYRENSKYQFPIFRNPEDPPEVIANMLFHSTAQKKRFAYKRNYDIDHKKNNFVISSGYLNQKNISLLCDHYRIPLVKQKIISHEEIDNLNIDFYPVVLKGLNKSIIHKTEFNAVSLNIRNKEELISASYKIADGFSKKGFLVEEFLIQQYVKPKHELLIGGFRDPSFGPIIIFGAGGKYVEYLDDSVIRSCYLTDEDIADMIATTKIGKILSGVRGEKPADISMIKQILKSCAQIMLEITEITELDINPLIVDEENNCCAVDIRINSMQF